MRSHPPKEHPLLRCSLAPAPVCPVPKPLETSSQCSTTSSEWGGGVSVIYPGAVRYSRTATTTSRATAAQQDTAKQVQYGQKRWSAYRFMPLSAETLGRLGTPMMCLLSDVRSQSIPRWDSLFTKEEFVSGIVQVLGLSLCKTNVCLEHGVSGFLLKARGVCLELRHAQGLPTAEVSDLDKSFALYVFVDICVSSDSVFEDVCLGSLVNCSLCQLWPLAFPVPCSSGFVICHPIV
jgi:hypothetical protein